MPLVGKEGMGVYIGSLLGKLEVDCREAAIAWAWRHGFVEEENGAEGS